jgi:hypothetical protein
MKGIKLKYVSPPGRRVEKEGVVLDSTIYAILKAQKSKQGRGLRTERVGLKAGR